MGHSRRFEIFLDCLWGLALLVAWHLVPFGSIATEELKIATGSPAQVIHAAMLVTFAYTYVLRLRRHLLGFQQTSTSHKHRD